MTRILSAAVLLAAFLAGAVALAQGQATNAASEGPGAGAQRTIAPASERAQRESARHGDARLCLEFPTNLQIIMCAEKYLPHRRKS